MVQCSSGSDGLRRAEVATFDPALTPQEQVAELMRDDEDLPEVLIAEVTPKEVVS